MLPHGEGLSALESLFICQKSLIAKLQILPHDVEHFGLVRKILWQFLRLLCSELITHLYFIWTSGSVVYEELLPLAVQDLLVMGLMLGYISLVLSTVFLILMSFTLGFPQIPFKATFRQPHSLHLSEQNFSVWCVKN